MSGTFARGAAGTLVQRSATLTGWVEKLRLARMQREMDAIARGPRPLLSLRLASLNDLEKAVA